MRNVTAMRAFASSFVFVALVACSGTTAPIGGDASTDGGCIQPVEGASCSSNDVACQPPGNICCVGYSWMCQNGSWFKAGVGCACQVTVDAGPFACGPSLTCDGTQKICIDQAPGIAYADGGTPPDSFSCNPIPSACLSTPTCACVVAQKPCPTQVSSCDDTSGGVKVYCMGQ